MAAKSATKKTAKTTTAKKSTSKAPAEKAPVKEEVVEMTPAVEVKPEASTKSKSHPVLYTVLIVILLMIIGGVFFRRQFVVALVNGQPVFRYHFVKALEAQAGKDILEQMVTEKLIEAEAKAKGVTVTPEEVDREIATITEDLKTRGQDINEALTAQGMTLEQLKQQIRLKLLVTALATAGLTVTDEEVTAYMTENQESLPKGKDVPANLKDMIKEQLTQTKQQEAVQAWVKGLREKATVQYW